MASPPYVWLENSFNNAGLDHQRHGEQQRHTIAGYTFAGANTGPVPANAGAPSQTINFIAPDFHNPANWKQNLAIDHEAAASVASASRSRAIGPKCRRTCTTPPTT